MSYEVRALPTAQKQYRKLPSGIRTRIGKQLATLADNPRPAGVVKLQGVKDRWRIRVGNYRIVYRIDEAGNVIIVLIIAHRRDAYRSG